MSANANQLPLNNDDTVASILEAHPWLAPLYSDKPVFYIDFRIGD